MFFQVIKFQKKVHMAAIHTWFIFSPFLEAEYLKTSLIILAMLVRLNMAPHTALGSILFCDRNLSKLFPACFPPYLLPHICTVIIFGNCSLNYLVRYVDFTYVFCILSQQNARSQFHKVPQTWPKRLQAANIMGFGPNIFNLWDLLQSFPILSSCHFFPRVPQPFAQMRLRQAHAKPGIRAKPVPPRHSPWTSFRVYFWPLEWPVATRMGFLCLSSSVCTSIRWGTMSKRNARSATLFCIVRQRQQAIWHWIGFLKKRAATI